MGRLAARLRGGARADGWFEPTRLDVACWNLFDLGVVDRRRRGVLDVFTSNHNSRQSLLENDGTGAFRDTLTEAGLDQDRAFPGWADDVTEPVTDGTGIYLYRRGNAVVLKAAGAGARAPMGGTIEFRSPVKDPGPSAISAVVTGEGNDGGTTTVRFAAGRPGELLLRPELVGQPVVVDLDRDVPLDQVYVGPSRQRPPAHRFELRLKDRHGMAWHRRDGDGPLDLAIVRGGLRGKLDAYGDAVRDELFVDASTGYHDGAAASRLTKAGCRSRQAAWVPVPDQDRLHLFVSCHGSAPLLYRQGADGSFADVAAEVGLAGAHGQHFSWVDVHGTGDLALVGVDGGRATVLGYDRACGRFATDQVVALRGEGTRKLAAGDYDGDGDADLFAPAPDGNTLLVNDGGTYRAVDPRAVNLPGAGGVTAAWVDYDNDGRADLHVLPGGLYRQGPDGMFAATRHLAGHDRQPVADARVAWFDASGSGARDALIATVATSKAEGGGFDWTATLHRNVGASSHWLQVELEGPPGNRHALGASVQVVAGGRTTTQWVGCNEGSHFSQGHFRMYFGLGQAATAESVRVQWPDGAVEVLDRPMGDELVVLRALGG